ncbi:PUA-like domain-containing protein [Cladorrhinum sp. PSN259]|nr:PUA-like domain-containing protein [Cladorrhinum sp. PSN259]
MPKRKSTHAAEEPSLARVESRRRSVRLQKLENDDAHVASQNTKKPTNGSKKEHVVESEPVVKKHTSKSDAKAGKETVKLEDEPLAKKKRSGKQQPKAKATEATAPSPKENKAVEANDTSTSSTSAGQEKNYWLLKAEPESRFENGIDVKFSIDDLAAKTEPEPWDGIALGIRNYAARNNLRAMKKGDLAFFYHSNCKEPGIVGIMEIVKEHSPDISAHNPKAPYYDPKSKSDDPKWSVVHVKFHRKFQVPIGLKELKEMGGNGKPLENMQMIRQSRLSVSKVSREEWEYLIGVAEEKAKGV